MKHEQALELIKQVIDEAIKAGVFKTLDAAALIYNAFETLKKNDNNTNSN